MLTEALIEEYYEAGAIVVPDVLSLAEIDELRRVTDDFREPSRSLSPHNDSLALLRIILGY
jgi:hypothetical protein